MANEQNLKPFKKGDPRINRKGRPKSFDKLRELAQQIANEPAINAKTGEPLVINGHIVTQIEAMLRLMVNDKKARALFLEYAYGKPKQQHELSGAVDVEQRTTFDFSNITDETIAKLYQIATSSGTDKA